MTDESAMSSSKIFAVIRFMAHVDEDERERRRRDSKVWRKGDKDVERWRAISDWERFRGGEIGLASRDKEFQRTKLVRNNYRNENGTILF